MRPPHLDGHQPSLLEEPRQVLVGGNLASIRDARIDELIAERHLEGTRRGQAVG